MNGCDEKFDRILVWLESPDKSICTVGVFTVLRILPNISTVILRLVLAAC